MGRFLPWSFSELRCHILLRDRRQDIHYGHFTSPTGEQAIPFPYCFLRYVPNELHISLNWRFLRLLDSPDRDQHHSDFSLHRIRSDPPLQGLQGKEWR